MFAKARIYCVYQTAPARLFRLILACILVGGLMMDIYHGLFPRLSLFFLSLLLMVEVFFHFKLGKTRPTLPLSENDRHLFLSLTWPAFRAYVNSVSTEKFIQTLLSQKSAQFILEKAEITPQEVTVASLTKDEIVTYAARVAKELHG